MSERFRDSAWDNQLDNMLDDLQHSVSEGGGKTVPYQNGHSLANGHTSREYQERKDGNTKEVTERTTRVAGGAGQPYSYREERQFTSTTTSSGGGAGPMGSKRGGPGNLEQHIIDEKKTTEGENMRGRSDSLVSDLSSIAKVRSVSKVSSSTERHYTTDFQTTSSSSNTQQSIKKNITDLDHLLNNLSSHSSGAPPSLPGSKQGSREGSPSRRGHGGHGVHGGQGGPLGHVSRTDERRERLISNASQYRSPSLTRTPNQSRPHSPHSSIAPPHFPSSQPRTPEPTNQQDFNSQTSQQYTSTMRSSVSQASGGPEFRPNGGPDFRPSQVNGGPEFRPVHTVPDPLTGRYADGRITPNHGYTRNFSTSLTGSPMLPRRNPGPDSNIPKKPDELLTSLGQEVDQREMARITQEESVSRSQAEMMKPSLEPEQEAREPTKPKPGPPVYYPTQDLFTQTGKDVETKEGELGGQQGQYFSAAYAREKGSSSKQESGEKGGAAVIPICLPLCCAAPCVIL